MRFPELQAKALTKARAKHAAMRHRHEAYAVILEELDEVKAVVWHDGLGAELLKELVHTAAMCQRAAEDLGLVVKDNDWGETEELATVPLLADAPRAPAPAPSEEDVPGEWPDSENHGEPAAPAPSEALLPCPFCGAPPVVVMPEENYGGPECHTPNCPASPLTTGDWLDTRAAHFAVWNRRVAPREPSDEAVARELLATSTYCSQMQGEWLDGYVLRWVGAVAAARARAGEEAQGGNSPPQG